jgi:hypothetical protein
LQNLQDTQSRRGVMAATLASKTSAFGRRGSTPLDGTCRGSSKAEQAFCKRQVAGSTPRSRLFTGSWYNGIIFVSKTNDSGSTPLLRRLCECSKTDMRQSSKLVTRVRLLPLTLCPLGPAVKTSLPQSDNSGSNPLEDTSLPDVGGSALDKSHRPYRECARAYGCRHMP